MTGDRRFFTFTDDDLPAFVSMVNRLKADGMSVTDIAKRFSIGRTTLNERLRKAKKASDNTG